MTAQVRTLYPKIFVTLILSYAITAGLLFIFVFESLQDKGARALLSGPGLALLFLALGIAAIVSWFLTRSFQSPMESLTFKINKLIGQRNEQEAVFRSMAEGVVVLDNELRIKYLNPSSSEILALYLDDVKGKRLESVLSIPTLQKLILDSVREGSPTEGDIIFMAPEEKNLRVTVNPLRNDFNDRAGIVLVMSDITRLRKLESHRRDFVANVSHELRTPLTSIQGFAETLMNPELKDDTQREEFLKIIHNHANRLGAIVEDLLSLSRLERETEREEIELHSDLLLPVLQSAIKLCELKAKERGSIVHLECPGDLKARINGPLLEHAIVNLLDNALKYSPPGTRVDISAAPLKREQMVQIRVTDQGPGISREHLPRIFERFYRVDKARSRNMGGTGLGLAIAKHIVMAHRGKIDVKSELGKGTEFILNILE